MRSLGNDEHGAKSDERILVRCKGMTARDRLQVRVNDELVLDAGTCEWVQGRHGPEWLIQPPATTLFHQVFAYLRAITCATALAAGRRVRRSHLPRPAASPGAARVGW